MKNTLPRTHIFASAISDLEALSAGASRQHAGNAAYHISEPLPQNALCKARRNITEKLKNDPAGLTPREADICARIATGQSAAEIIQDQGISINTITTHRTRAYSKLGIKSQAELFARLLHSLILKD